MAATALSLAAVATAQGWAPPDPTNDPWNKSTLKLGPFFVAPSFDLRNVGVDNNVFRDPQNPKQDLTATIAVQTLVGAHVKAFSTTLSQDNHYIWFRRYTSERSIDGGLRVASELRLTNVRPWFIWSKLGSHDRTGYEIDARAGHTNPLVEVGSDFNLGYRTGVTLSVNQQELTYDNDATFDGVALRLLNTKTLFAHANAKWQYTDFTDITGSVEFSRARFVNDPARDADTLTYLVGFQSHGEAPLLGRAQVGYKRQTHQNSAMPDFHGPVFFAGVSTVALDRVKIDFSADRDIAYSYERQFPFYVQQGAGVTLTGRLSTRFDVIASERAEWLDYSETFLEGGSPLDARKDRANVASLGVLYTMGGAGSHFGLTFERAERVSPISRKNYSNDRVLTNIKFSF